MRAAVKFAVAVAATVAALFGAPVQAAPLVESVHLDCTALRTITLKVKPVTVNLDGQATFNTRAYHYNDVPMIPGPTIHMKQGRRCSIRIVNNLPTAGTQHCLDSLAATNGTVMNMFHCPDVTNLHTHGKRSAAAGICSSAVPPRNSA
jgi:FtsP/CotA-like multicopper oxidase with cupredoxin domain